MQPTGNEQGYCLVKLNQLVFLTFGYRTVQLDEIPGEFTIIKLKIFVYLVSIRILSFAYVNLKFCSITN
jgi:hypothetical protein